MPEDAHEGMRKIPQEVINAARPRLQAILQNADQQLAQFSAHIQQQTVLQAFLSGFLYALDVEPGKDPEPVVDAQEGGEA